MFRPRSLSARLFLATTIVSCVALTFGIWLVRRVATFELEERIVTRATAAPEGDDTEVKREVVRQIVAGPNDAPMAPVGVDRRVLAAFAFVLVGSAIATAIVARRVIGPVGTLRDAADALARGQLNTRVPVEGAEELAALATTFNLMAARLEEQERLKRDLTNDVAHELRTPITNLRCHLEAIADGVVVLTPDAISTIADDVRQLERLVDDLGVLAQADAKKLQLDPEAVDAAAVLDHLVRDLGPRAAAAQLSLRDETPQGLPPMWIDRGRLVQVLTNLVANAIAHTPAGGSVTLRAARDVDAARRDADVIRIDVADTGDGIAPEHLPYVFDRFYRADPSRSRRTGGAGLGLAIARQIVTASGGRIDVASEAGRGTTFSVWLPIAPA